MEKEMLIELSNITKIIGNVWLLKNIDLKIYRNEGIGIIGQKGSGKALLTKVISNEIRQTSGLIDYNFAKDNVMESIGIQMKTPDWPLGFKTKEIVNLYKAIYKIVDVAWVDELLTVFDVKPIWNKRLSGLEIGWLQLFSLFLAFIHKPEIVILGDLTNDIGLDVRLSVMDFLKKYKMENNASYILVNPDSYTFSELCDRVVVLEQGQIVHDEEVANWESTMTLDIYSQNVVTELITKTVKKRPNPVFNKLLKKYEGKTAPLKEKLLYSIDQLQIVDQETNNSIKAVGTTLIDFNNIIFFIDKIAKKIEEISLSTMAIDKNTIKYVKDFIKTLTINVKKNKKMIIKNGDERVINMIEDTLKEIGIFINYVHDEFLPIFQDKKLVINGNEYSVEMSPKEAAKLKALKKKYISQEIKLMNQELKNAKKIKRQNKMKKAMGENHE